MTTRAILLFAALSTLTACDDPASAAADATPDATPDAIVADAPSPDAPADSVAADSPGDAASADVVSDLGRVDAGEDVSRADGAVDSATPDVIADAGPRDVPTMDVGGCNGSAPSCVSGTPGGTCSDALTVATCVGGAWRCSDGMIFTSLCACIGRPPGSCTCGPTGWNCDAGAPDAADSGTVDCDPSHVACDARPPVCTGGGEVPSVSGACWGPCVLYTRCAPIACDPAVTGSCPINLVCYRTTRTCGPPL